MMPGSGRGTAATSRTKIAERLDLPAEKKWALEQRDSLAVEVTLAG